MDAEGKIALGKIDYPKTFMPTASLDITGSDDLNLLRIRSDSHDSIIYVTGSGRVGIGTVTPSASLHIMSGSSGALKSSLADELIIESSAHVGVSLMGGNDSTGAIYFADGKQISSGAGFVKYDHNIDHLVLKTTDSFIVQTGGENTRLTVDSAGLVGIGTVDPKRPLHIQYSNNNSSGLGANWDTSDGYGVQIENTNTTSKSYASLDFRTYNFDARIAARYDGATNSGSLHFITDVASGSAGGPSKASAMVIRDNVTSQFVGIGTEEPTSKLHISGSDNTSLFGVHSNSSASILTVSGSGYIGINHEAPSSSLHVVSSDEVVARFQNTNSTNGGIQIWSGGASESSRIYFHDGEASNINGGRGIINYYHHGDELQFWIGGDKRILFESAGNILPEGDATQTLGNSSKRWSQLHVGAIYETSERQLKENITPQTSELDNIMKLNPIDFSWRDNNKKSKGFIADEVEEVYPELVAKDEEGKASGIEYSKMVSVLTQGIKELNEIVNKQQETIEKLLKKIEDKN